MATPAGKERYRKIQHNLALTGCQSRVLAQFSIPALYTLLQEEMEKENNAGFDWIYVDGSHRADDTFLDAELAWRLARPGCVFIFDDYNWNVQPVESPEHPRRGIDAFLALHAGEYNRLSTNPEPYQMVLQKTTPMRIGFLLQQENRTLKSLDQVFGYGINIAFSIDSSYAMSAAVTMRSVVETTQGRITFYVLDCGLSNLDKEMIKSSLPFCDNSTLLFVELPHDNLTNRLGPVWGKVDMIKCLPVERVLYLDADVLVRRDLSELWNTNLEGRSLAAVPDVGCPLGHEGVPNGPYFNAGVLLIDLAKARIDFPLLELRCHQFKRSRFYEQDALNVHFSGELNRFLPNSLRWALAVVLNPYVQPYTSKPWGYAGAPGHPFEEEWWIMLGKTAWKGWETTPQYQKMCERARKEAL